MGCLSNSHPPPPHLTSNLGLYGDWEMNGDLLLLGDCAQPAESHWSLLSYLIFKKLHMCTALHFFKVQALKVNKIK